MRRILFSFLCFSILNLIECKKTRFWRKETFVVAIFALIAIANSLPVEDLNEYEYIEVLKEYVPPEDSNKYHPLKEKHDEFDWALFKAFANKKKGENVVISPYSVKILLSVLAEAAVGETKEEFRSLLPKVEPEFIRQHYSKILSSLAELDTAYELYQGNNFYIENKLTPAETFLDVIKANYNTSTYQIDFSDNVRTASIINKWVENVTQGHIKDLVSAEKIKDYAAVLVNAIYFKGAWETPFNPESTKVWEFQVNDEKTVKVQTMISERKGFYYIYSQELKSKLLRLPYKGRKYAMTFILPDESENIDDVIARIEPGLIQSLQERLRNTAIQVCLPKFKFQSSSHLKEVIKSLQIRKVFESTAELPLLGDNLVLSDVIQKAGVAIDEKGTVAFAATEVDIEDRSLGRRFEVDRPFVFFVEDENSGALLFAGRVVDPTAA